MLGHLNYYPRTQVFGPVVYSCVGTVIYYPRTHVLGRVVYSNVETLDLLFQESSVGTFNLLSQNCPCLK